MSVSLDDIWDAPTEPQPRAKTPSAIPIDLDDDLPGPSPAKRPRTKLFLSDSEDGSPKKPPPPRSSATSNLNPEINALFDDLEPDPDDAPAELAPSLDLDALRRQAAARHVAKVPSLTPREILPSSSPTRDLDDGDGDVGKGNKDAGDGEKPKRRQIQRLNEARLLGPDGFPALVKQIKDFKPKGKGHEVCSSELIHENVVDSLPEASDLNRLMQTYQFWTHKLYPKNHFQENVQRIEKLCHSKRMTVCFLLRTHHFSSKCLQVALSVWRDEAKGLVNGRKVTNGVLDLTSDGEQEDEEHPRDAVPGQTSRASSTSVPASPVPHHSRASTPPSRPPSSASERTSTFDDDDIDIDALIQEDAERQAAAVLAREPSPSMYDTSSNYRSNTRPTRDSDAMDEDDDALWSSFNDPSLFDDPSVLAASTSAATSVTSGSVAPQDDDEEMWQMLREQEEEEERARNQSDPPTASKSSEEPRLHPRQESPQRRPTNEEGWDEMYL